MDQTYFNGVLLVGQLENTVCVGTCNSLRPFVSRREDIARIWPSWLKHILSAEVVMFITDLMGVRSVAARERPRPRTAEAALCLSLYRLTTPLSAPTARKLDDTAREEVMVPSSLWKRSTHLRLPICHLYTSPSLPLPIIYSPSSENTTARTLPFIFKSPIHCLLLPSTKMTYPSLPKKAMILPSGDIVNFSRLRSCRPTMLGIFCIFPEAASYT
mmetsp:Transcript_6459/g.14574  ORF Transcript_6459/g.14574 Transcript_6459/m.14574 type:complete len:215 (-) Transcript_6459:1303-1947(-)